MESIETKSDELKTKTREELQLEASRRLKKIHRLIYNKNFKRAESLLEEAIKLYKTEPEILMQFEVKYLTVLIKKAKYNEAIEKIKDLKEKYKENNEIIATLESIELKAYLELGEYETVISKVPKLIEKYPEKEGTFETQKMEAYLKTGREKFVADNALLYADKYPKVSNVFIIQRLKALMQLGRYEEVYKIDIEDEKNNFNRNDVKARIGRLKAEALIRDGKINEAIDEINRLRMVYHVKESFFEAQKNMINRKIKEIKSISLDKLIEADEEEFMKYAKNLDIKHFTFLQVARYKHEKRNKIALATIEEYKRRSKENADLDFADKLKQLAVSKKRAFDFMKWIKLSKTLNLSFSSNTQSLPDLSTAFELEK